MLALLESLWKWRLNTWLCDSSWIHSLGLCNWVTENILPPFQDIEEMFENYGIRVSFDLISLWNFQWCDGTSSIVNKALFFLPPQLPLLKALIDRLLQDGIEELLQVLTTSKKKEKTDTHTSNVITEYTVRNVNLDFSCSFPKRLLHSLDRKTRNIILTTQHYVQNMLRH